MGVADQLVLEGVRLRSTVPGLLLPRRSGRSSRVAGKRGTDFSAGVVRNALHGAQARQELRKPLVARMVCREPVVTQRAGRGVDLGCVGRVGAARVCGARLVSAMLASARRGPCLRGACRCGCRCVRVGLCPDGESLPWLNSSVSIRVVHVRLMRHLGSATDWMHCGSATLGGDAGRPLPGPGRQPGAAKLVDGQMVTVWGGSRGTRRLCRGIAGPSRAVSEVGRRVGTEGEALASARVVKAQGRTSVGGGAQGGGEVLVVLHSGDRDDIEAASELPGFGWRQGLTLPVRVII